MEVQKISEMCIKPYSTTLPHLKTYKISLIDQCFAQSLHIPMILYYSNKDTNLSSNMSMLLKQSLSEALTLYYPLAGRIKDSFAIDCNDEGVLYIDARANISLSQYLAQPDLASLDSLLPGNDHKRCLTIIQETIFACGSIAIGVLGSHMIMDGTALVSFLKCWAAIARSSTEDIVPPNFDGPSIFPQYEVYPEEANLFFPRPFLKTGKLAQRRFVVDAISIANLKAEGKTSRLENPTRVEVVSAFFMECIAVIQKERSLVIDRPFAFNHIVSLRQRATPPIPKSSLGNFLHLAPGLCSPEEINIADIVYKQREAIRKIDSDLVESLKSEGFNKLHEMFKEVLGDPAGSSTFAEIGVSSVVITSWCNFGLYEIDFGWGKPDWVSFTGFPSPKSVTPFFNTIILIDTAVNKGIEAWILMDEEELGLLENHKPFLQYVSLNPCPLELCNK